MQQRQFKPFDSVSALTLGGGGLGQVWGETSREEAVATVNLAIEKGITHLDVAPMYGKGEAEKVVGEVFKGKDLGEKLIISYPESAAARYWFLVNLGSWAEVYGTMAAAKEGVAGLMRNHAKKITIRLDALIFVLIE